MYMVHTYDHLCSMCHHYDAHWSDPLYHLSSLWPMLPQLLVLYLDL